MPRAAGIRADTRAEGRIVSAAVVDIGGGRAAPGNCGDRVVAGADRTKNQFHKQNRFLNRSRFRPQTEKSRGKDHLIGVGTF